MKTLTALKFDGERPGCLLWFIVRCKFSARRFSSFEAELSNSIRKKRDSVNSELVSDLVNALRWTIEIRSGSAHLIPEIVLYRVHLIVK